MRVTTITNYTWKQIYDAFINGKSVILTYEFNYSNATEYMTHQMIGTYIGYGTWAINFIDHAGDMLRFVAYSEDDYPSMI